MSIPLGEPGPPGPQGPPGPTGSAADGKLDSFNENFLQDARVYLGALECTFMLCVTVITNLFAVANECLTDNGGCDQYCVDTYDSYFCHCLDGYSITGQSAAASACPGSQAL